jgi:nitrogen fixation protein FixH
MNREIDAMRKQTERGWTADVAMTLKSGHAPVSVSFTDRTHTPVSGLDVTARLAHPALTRADHAVKLIETRPGHYAAEAPDVQPGGWGLVIEARLNGERVFASRNRIVLTEGRP